LRFRERSEPPAFHSSLALPLRQRDPRRRDWKLQLEQRRAEEKPNDPPRTGGLEALKGHWDKEEYAAGYRARLTAIPDVQGAHHCWRVGWEDADTEFLELARHNQAIAEGWEDDFSDTWGLLFDAGGDARVNGIPRQHSNAALCGVLDLWAKLRVVVKRTAAAVRSRAPGHAF